MIYLCDSQGLATIFELINSGVRLVFATCRCHHPASLGIRFSPAGLLILRTLLPHCRSRIARFMLCFGEAGGRLLHPKEQSQSIKSEPITIQITRANAWPWDAAMRRPCSQRYERGKQMRFSEPTAYVKYIASFLLGLLP